MTPGHVAILGLAGTLACASSGSPPPEKVTQVSISGPLGNIGGAELHNVPGVGSRVVAASVDSVWRVLPDVYRMLGIPEPGADVERRVFGAQRFRGGRIEGRRLSTYIDCGMGPTAMPKADTYEVTMSVLTRLSEANGGGTVVETTLEATGEPRAAAGHEVYCQSTGELETRVVELLLWHLVSGQ